MSCMRMSPWISMFRSHLTPFHQAWSAVTSDRWVLEIIAQGYPIQLHSLLLTHTTIPLQGPFSQEPITNKSSLIGFNGAVEQVLQEY